MYSIAISTVLALLLLCWAAVPDAMLLVVPLLPPLPLASAPLLESRPLLVEGKSAAISKRALLMRLRRPCSAILCEVRFDVRFVERASGYETPGRWLPSRMF